MKWIEIIRLRVTDGSRHLLESELDKLIEEAGKMKKQAVMAYTHSLIDTDYCVQIAHDSTTVEHAGSSLGLRLVAALKEFGLVSHSVWSDFEHK